MQIAKGLGLPIMFRDWGMELPFTVSKQEHSTTTIANNVRQVKSPHAEIGGFIFKKTTVATIYCDETTTTPTSAIECISFHGYNGQPRKNVSSLVNHVKAVLAVLQEPDDDSGTTSNAIFAGDFNTWTPEHLTAVSNELQTAAGFRLVHSWTYPGNINMLLDHEFVRGTFLHVSNVETFSNASDHNGAIFDVTIQTAAPVHRRTTCNGECIA